MSFSISSFFQKQTKLLLDGIAHAPQRLRMRFRRKPATTFWQVTLFCGTIVVATTENSLRQRAHAYVGLPLESFVFNYRHEARKRKLFETLRNSATILELGPGVGSNFETLPEGITWTGVDKNVFLDDQIRAHAAAAGLPPSSLVLHHQDIDAYLASLPSNSEANIVCTLVLSCVKDPHATVKEIYRVLKPRGKLYFVEQNRFSSFHPGRMLQLLAHPLQAATRDGLVGDNPCAEAVVEAGFGRVHMEQWPWTFLANDKEDRRGISRVKVDLQNKTVSGLRGWLRTPLIAGVALKTTRSVKTDAPKLTSAQLPLTSSASLFHKPLTMEQVTESLSAPKKEEKKQQ